MIFQSNNHSLQILKNVNSMKKQKEFCDVQIKVDDVTFNAHKLILAASSEYFYAMFNGNLQEKYTDCVKLNDISAQTFQLILDFIYSSKVDVTNENVIELLSKASMLQITHIQQFCCQFLCKQLDVSNCIGIYTYAEVHNCMELMHVSMTFIQDNFLNVVENEEFLQVPKEILLEVISSENLNIDCEWQVFEAVIKWILKDATKRRKSAYYLLEEVRLALINQNKMEKFIHKCPDFALSVVLRHIMRDVAVSKSSLELESKLPSVKKKMIQPRLKARKNVYICGGYSHNPGQRWGESQGTCSMEMFSVYHGIWEKKASMNHARNSHCSIVFDGKIYVFGGENDSMVMDSVEVYDPHMNIWSEIHPMPIPRSQHSCCIVDNCIYFFGGWIGAEISDKIECFNLTTGQWTTCGQLHQKRCAIGTCCVNGQIYLIGGQNELGYDTDAFSMFDPITQRITILQSLPYAVSQSAVLAVGNSIYAIGGSQDKQCISSVSSFCLQQNSWQKVARMKIERCCASAVAINDQIYVIGGRISHHNNISVSSTLDTIEVYDPGKNCWEIDKYPKMKVSRCEASAVVL